MKKLITVLGSILIIAGLKAQPETPVRKETAPAVKPVAKSTTSDSLKNMPGIPEKQVASKANVAKPSPVVTKENVTLPSKNSPVAQPVKN